MTDVHIHRLSNGTIDIDHYRQQALTARRAAMRGFPRVAAPYVRPAAAIMVLVLTLWAMPGRPVGIDGDMVAQARAMVSHTIN